MADQRLTGLADGIFFAPFDYRSAVRRVLRRLRPALVVVLETEIWPNLYRESKRAGAALMVVNGRISDRALPRYRRWHGFFRHVLRWPDAILVQTAEDQRRYVAAGAPPARVRVAGNIKYDFTPPASGLSGGLTSDIAQFLERTDPLKIWIAASTMPPMEAGDVDEDDAVIDAFQSLAAVRESLLLILAPRRPERFDIVAGKLERARIHFVRRSRLADRPSLSLPGVLLLDSIGELAALFERADAVFMGGTLAARGGHNILEPAYFAKPVIVGPHMENFAAIAVEFRAAGALAGISSASELSAAVADLLADSSRSAQLGSRAQDLAMAKRGVVARVASEIWRALAEGAPNPPHHLAARVLLTPLSWLWRAGHRINMARSLASRKSLLRPVVSIGALSMGGAGKSPMVAHLAHRLRAMGRDPAILTRGYRRKSPEAIVIVKRGTQAPPALTGDEAQIFIRAGDAHVGIGPDRFEVGARVEQDLAPDIFLLDDGFQHVRIDRKNDVVLIDALDPFGGGVFPLGRFREPLESLKRATEIVVTRVEPGQDISGLKRTLKRYSAAPVFSSHVVPRQWVDLETSATRAVSAPGFHSVAAFCGLGMPRTFWRTLEQLGLEIVFRWDFGDHHHYRPSELRRLAGQGAAAGADVLVTTEKDVINLCDGAPAIVAPRKLFWLKIGIEMENEEQFLRRIL